MKDVLRGMITAFSLYSAIPMPHTEWNGRAMRYALCFMPFIGVVIGGAELLWLLACLAVDVTPALFAAVAVLLPILISGGIHMDGFIDTADAIASHGDREKRLAILKDSHVGAFGVLFLGCQLLLSFGLWQQVYAVPGLAGLALAGFVVSRCLNALTIATFPTARSSGLVHLFAGNASKGAVVASAAAVLALMLALCLWISLPWGLLAFALAALLLALHRRFCLRGFGGNTGDLAGFLLQNTELLFLGVAALGGVVI